jgi:transposase-like protein
MANFFTLVDFCSNFPTDDVVYDFLLYHRVFYDTISCPNCGNDMKRDIVNKVFRCHKRTCPVRGRISMRKHTFFYGSMLSFLDILKIAHLWLAKVSVESCILLTGHSSATISHFFGHLRNLVASNLNEENQVIGGPDVIVEVDETKLGKRKYHRGHRVDGVWVIVGIERTPEKKIFLVPVQNRNAITLRNILSKHVHQGSIIYTDLWKGYHGIENLGFEHYTVNHSQTFRDPITGVCTNTVEGLNSGLKRRIPIRNRTENDIENHLGEYIWRRQNKNDLFNGFIKALRDVHYDIE